MFAIHRAVQLKSFRVIEADFEFIEHDSEEADPKTQLIVDFDNYDINIEYQINDIEQGTLALSMSIAVNNDEEPEHGYSIFVLGMMVLEVVDWANDEEDEQDYGTQIQEAVQLGIGAIRGYMMNLTAIGLLGPYTLPNFDPEDFDEDFDDEFNGDDTDLDDGVRSLHLDRRR